MALAGEVEFSISTYGLLGLLSATNVRSNVYTKLVKIGGHNAAFKTLTKIVDVFFADQAIHLNVDQMLICCDKGMLETLQLRATFPGVRFYTSML